MQLRNVFAIAGIMLIGFACQDEASPEGINLKMKATSSTATISGGRSSSGRLEASSLVFTEVMVGLKKIEFETEQEDNQEDQSGHEDEGEEVEFEGNFQVDLIAGTSNPDFGLGNLQPGSYDKIELKLAPALANGHSISIKFTLDGVNYELTSDEKLEIEIEHEGGFQLDANSISNILILLNLDSLIAHVNLAGAVAGSDGVVHINSTSNVTLYTALLSGFRDSCEAGEDDDHDNEVDDD